MFTSTDPPQSRRGSQPQHGPTYLPLVDYLGALPLEQASVTLTFTELEELVGPLSLTARTSQSFWNAIVRGRAWRAQHGGGER